MELEQLIRILSSINPDKDGALIVRVAVPVGASTNHFHTHDMRAITINPSGGILIHAALDGRST